MIRREKKKERKVTAPSIISDFAAIKRAKDKLGLNQDNGVGGMDLLSDRDLLERMSEYLLHTADEYIWMYFTRDLRSELKRRILAGRTPEEYVKYVNANYAGYMSSKEPDEDEDEEETF